MVLNDAARSALRPVANGLEQKRSLGEFFDWYNRRRSVRIVARLANTGRGLCWQVRADCGSGGVTQWRSDAVNLWTVGCADTRLTAQARSPMDKPGKTPCVSPTLPTGRRLPTSFTAPPQHQGLNLIPGKVQPFSRRRALAYSSRNLSKQAGPPQVFDAGIRLQNPVG